MKLHVKMTTNGMARSRSEAERMIKAGSVSIGGCAKDCDFFSFLKCNCGGWEKATNPAAEVPEGWRIKVASGNWRCVPRIDGRQGFDQLRGIC